MKVFDGFANRQVSGLFREIVQPDRRALDDVVLDVSGLTAGGDSLRGGGGVNPRTAGEGKERVISR